MSYHKLPGGASLQYQASQWIPIYKTRIKPNFTYRRGHPAGYTDDLGIIADRNQWVEAVTGGYHSTVDPQDYTEMYQWCTQNLRHNDWCMGVYYVILQREEDVAWFMLRWS
jgi:hypothetical protein